MKLLSAPAGVLRLDSESHGFIFRERVDTVFALPVGYSVEYLLERGLFVLGISAVLPVEVTLEGSLYHIRPFSSLFTRTLTVSLEELSVYPVFGPFHTPELYVLIDRAGSLWQENGLVFASETGAPLDRRDLTTRQFKPLLERAGLPQKTRFHDLRHTCATLLLTKNVNPKVVSEMLGHSNIAITLDTYSHVLPNMQDSAARALEEALS